MVRAVDKADAMMTRSIKSGSHLPFFVHKIIALKHTVHWFYHATLRKAQYCYGKFSVRPSAENR